MYQKPEKLRHNALMEGESSRYRLQKNKGHIFSESVLPKYAIIPLILALVVNNCVYIGVAQFKDVLSFTSLATELDERIPFIAPFVIFYVFAYVQWGFNYILIGRDSKKMCYRFVLGDIFSKIICLLFFILLPTTLVRPEITGTDIFSKLVRFIYSVDSPVNLFPSIHCLESWCCIRAAFQMELKTPQRTRVYRVLTIIISLGVFASTLFIKQHVIVDVFGGISAFEIGLFLSGELKKRK